MSMNQLRRVMRAHSNPLYTVATVGRMKPRPFESSRIADQTRFEDSPPPTEDDMIKVHYFKHHPLYEYRNYQDFHVDNYRHWLHSRAEYWNTESHPAQISPWEMGSKFNHMFFVLLPVLSFWFLGNAYKEHLKQKNTKDPIVGVFSQCQF